MSKASEWAKVQLPEIKVGELIASVSHKIDWPIGASPSSTVEPLLTLQANLMVRTQPFHLQLSVEDALALGHWLLDTFGEASA